jgi:hypothetical protein
MDEKIIGECIKAKRADRKIWKVSAIYVISSWVMESSV